MGSSRRSTYLVVQMGDDEAHVVLRHLREKLFDCKSGPDKVERPRAEGIN